MSLTRVSQGVLPLTLEEAKGQCRIAPEIHDFDAEIMDLNKAATGKVSSMTGLILADETWELTVTDPVGVVALPFLPVTGLISVNGSADGYIIKIDGDCATVEGDWPDGDVAIRFTAGGDVPPELKHAIRILIAQWFRDREATGEQTVEVPYAVESLVSDYRRGWVKA